jgi:hypothetical protein
MLWDRVKTWGNKAIPQSDDSTTEIPTKVRELMEEAERNKSPTNSQGFGGTNGIWRVVWVCERERGKVDATVAVRNERVKSERRKGRRKRRRRRLVSWPKPVQSVIKLVQPILLQCEQLKPAENDVDCAEFQPDWQRSLRDWRRRLAGWLTARMQRRQKPVQPVFIPVQLVFTRRKLVEWPTQPIYSTCFEILPGKALTTINICDMSNFGNKNRISHVILCIKQFYIKQSWFKF